MTAARPDKRFFLFACLTLALGTLALYWPVSHATFIQFDDADFISDNPHVNTGLSCANVAWAFHDTHSGNWVPLTWISHMADCQFFGVNAGAHHLVNVGFHTANTLLLFALLFARTKMPWRSAVVAAFFAWHPLHVESVAWAAERKDVLSTFFFLLALNAYAKYVAGDAWRVASEITSRATRHAPFFYALALLFFVLGLMSKSMVVTLPFMLLLLDVWPLKRIQDSGFRIQDFKKLLVEKIPFLLLSCGFCALTFLAQRGANAVMHIPWQSQLANIPVAYLRYISKTLWPADLAVYYPFVFHWPTVIVIGAILALLGVSTLAIATLRREPWLAVGWFWFLGTLVPVIGIVQAGMQSMADRYAYIPSIGLFIVVVWGACELAEPRPALKKYLPVLAGVTLAGCLLAASLQISYWQNGVRLFTHAVQTTTGNYVALNSLGAAFRETGRTDDAIKIFEESARIEPLYWQSHRNLALALLEKNQPDAAFAQFEFVLAELPQDADLRYELSLRLLNYGRVEPAKKQLADALKLKPDFAEAHELLGAIFLQQTNLAAAIPHFDEALKINPNYAEAHLNLGLALEQQGKFAEAISQLRAAQRLDPDANEIKKSLGKILVEHPELKSQP